MKKLIHLLTAAMLMATVTTSCKDKIQVTGIKIDKETLMLPIGGTATLTANLLPYGATAKMNWTANNNMVTVESNDGESVISKGLVTAKNAGTAIITVATKDGKFTATCTVTVINPEPELIWVEGGTFTMGCTDGECPEDGREEPPHKVTLSSFKIAKYTVTQEQWEVIMGNNPSYFKGNNLPVEMVTWYDVQAFITKLNTLTGKTYRLPTEAEWEYAARGGNKSKGYKYSGSNDIDAVAWYNDNSNSKTHPIGTKAPNELGIYDMSGNVWEWCNDWYGAYDDAAQDNPTGSLSGVSRVCRGGCCANTDAHSCRVSSRNSVSPNSRAGLLGFRLVLP